MTKQEEVTPSGEQPKMNTRHRCPVHGPYECNYSACGLPYNYSCTRCQLTQDDAVDGPQETK